MTNRVDEQSVDALLAKMSVAQKVGQLVQTERMAITPAEVHDFHIGSVLSGGGSVPGQNRLSDWVEMNDAYWAASMHADASHLAIPLLYGVDAVHGNNNVEGATLFPHNIGLGAARDPDLVERIARVTALEVLAAGVEWTFAPTLAVARDLHWGRTYESYSSSPAIVADYAGRFVNGLQGDLGDDGVIACAKHWVGDGGTANGIDQGETTLPWEALNSIHLAPYLPALEAGVMTVMVSFNSWNGDKCHGHHQLLTDVLKGTLGFDGVVISDWDGIDYLDPDYGEAVAIAMNAGMDLFMVSTAWREWISHLTRHVESGRVSMTRLDDAVRRVLTLKKRYGLFTKPRPRDRKWSGHASFGSPAHRDVAREAVRKSMVLLQDRSALLPLAEDVRVFVTGRLADDAGAQCGGFTLAWQGQKGPIPGATSIWEGIRAIAPGAELGEQGVAADPTRHDVAVVVIGEDPYAEGLGDIRENDQVVVETGSMIRGTIKTMAPYGRSLELSQLHPEDILAIRVAGSAGVPVVAVLLSGRPLIIDDELELAAAFVAAWLPGSEGLGVGQVLFGQAPFAGRLGFDWPGREGVRFPVGYSLNTVV